MNKSSYTRATAKNRRKIQEAFAELLAERGSLSNITVTELADRAEITRGTFYNYYDNLYQVGAELQGEIERQLFAKYDDLDSLEAIENYIDEVYLYFEKQGGIFRELLASDASTDFLLQLENSMSQRVLAVLHKNGIYDKKAETELLFTTTGAIAIVRNYYRGEVDLTLTEIRDYLKAKIRWLFK